MTWAIFVFFFSSLGTASGVIRALDLLCEKLLPLSICTVQSVIFVYSLPSRMRYRELILIIMQSLTPLFVLSLSLSLLLRLVAAVTVLFAAFCRQQQQRRLINQGTFLVVFVTPSRAGGGAEQKTRSVGALACACSLAHSGCAASP